MVFLDNKVSHMIVPISYFEVVVHQQRIPEEEIIVEERPKKVDIVERKHRLDKHRLYFPGYL